MYNTLRIGILAIQGDVVEHVRMLEKLGAIPVFVKQQKECADINGIILPGGESTTMSLLLQRWGTFNVLRQRIIEGMPVWGTCAGAILLAKEVTGKNPPHTLAVMDIKAHRNAYGVQCNSFYEDITITLPIIPTSYRKYVTTSPHNIAPQNTALQIIASRKKTHHHTIPVAFIRAPKLLPLHGANIEVLATHRNEPVLLQQQHMLASAFHPELTTSTVIHQYFLDLCTSQ